MQGRHLPLQVQAPHLVVQLPSNATSLGCACAPSKSMHQNDLLHHHAGYTGHAPEHRQPSHRLPPTSQRLHCESLHYTTPCCPLTYARPAAAGQAVRRGAQSGVCVCCCSCPRGLRSASSLTLRSPWQRHGCGCPCASAVCGASGRSASGSPPPCPGVHTCAGTASGEEIAEP